MKAGEEDLQGQWIRTEDRMPTVGLGVDVWMQEVNGGPCGRRFVDAMLRSSQSGNHWWQSRDGMFHPLKGNISHWIPDPGNPLYNEERDAIKSRSRARDDS